MYVVQCVSRKERKVSWVFCVIIFLSVIGGNLLYCSWFVVTSCSLLVVTSVPSLWSLSVTCFVITSSFLFVVNSCSLFVLTSCSLFVVLPNPVYCMVVPHHCSRYLRLLFVVFPVLVCGTSCSCLWY